ncbi:hypothetical protein O181_059339 [Austropuccinia psidii MF-1]|uniref:Uncharacterized protein n=1 Tax=Austropuccinia psidii MF-1 TaxID=1389203 RepID=A0A9Q3HYJ3_9BASI|nr:hypothetical protein [Austropuccinia psidii MF-1]
MPSILLFLWPLIFSKAFNCYITLTARESTSNVREVADIYRLPPITAFHLPTPHPPTEQPLTEHPPTDPSLSEDPEFHNHEYIVFLITMGHQNSQLRSRAPKHPIFQGLYTVVSLRMNPNSHERCVTFSGNINQADHLKKLSSDNDVTFATPQLNWFSQLWEQSTSSYSKRLLDIHSAFRYLLDSKEVSPQEVAEWIDMFARITHIYHDNFQTLGLEALMRCGLYSLLVKFEGFPNEFLALKDYIHTLIELLEKRFASVKLRFRSVWLLELLFPDYGISSTMGNYETFVKETSYDSQFRAFHNLVAQKDSAQIQEKIDKLIQMSRKDSRGVSAASKTAAIIFLYHLATQKENNTLHLAAVHAIGFLKEKRSKNLFPHDSKLVKWIFTTIVKKAPEKHGSV